MSDQIQAVHLSEGQKAFLAEPYFAVVATIASDGMPHQTVMWYMLDGDQVVLSTPDGSLKHRHLQHDERISVCVEDGFRYLTLVGRVELETDPTTARELYRTIGARYMQGNRPAAPPAQPDPKVAQLLRRERVTIRLRLERINGQGVD